MLHMQHAVDAVEKALLRRGSRLGVLEAVSRGMSILSLILFPSLKYLVGEKEAGAFFCSGIVVAALVGSITVM